MRKNGESKDISLGDNYDGILSDLVKNGRFGTETEAVRAGIRMLADYEIKMRSLRNDPCCGRGNRCRPW